MKAILVIDMPKTCGECTLNCDGLCGAEQEPVHSIVCPLKPLPQKKNATKEWVKNTEDVAEAMKIGWNACLEEITGETE